MKKSQDRETGKNLSVNAKEDGNLKRNRDFEKEKEILKRQQKHTENTEENNFSYEMENEKIESLHVTQGNGGRQGNG